MPNIISSWRAILAYREALQQYTQHNEVARATILNAQSEADINRGFEQVSVARIAYATRCREIALTSLK